MNNRSYSAVRLTSSPGSGRDQRSTRWMMSTACGGRAPARAAQVQRRGSPPLGREAVENGPGRVGVALLDARSGPDDRLRPDSAEVADDGGRFDDRASADGAAVDHGAGPDDDVVLDDQLV